MSGLSGSNSSCRYRSNAMCCKCCSVRQQKIWVFGLGGVILAIGIFLAAAWPAVSRQWIRSLMPLGPNSFMYKRWVTTPMPIYSTIYLFNWTNPEHLNTAGVRPHFEQLGPYTFSDFKVKEDLLWSQQSPEVTYYGKRTWHFLPEKSNGSLEDVVVAPHFPSLVRITCCLAICLKAASSVRKYLSERGVIPANPAFRFRQLPCTRADFAASCARS